ncbi:hypothetical protein PRIPAC_78674 [Pristionchus pacificus]|uniref:Uncharacterized protein n=1 Tax=Pristionchus pacificus TaxID=54126 RepID=A0A2A6BI35_PRIPA|nr:hypothetical protein PRIPAC_78674 [Pristionchus pacificus]|eukprot:PDM65537.1 hypothetical protein PRIPAC_52479 [Pristionchus pacificus]
MISFCLAVLIACLLHNEGAATTAATEIIALASLCERGKYLQARADGSVGVGSTMDLWTWHGKQGESSSFMSANGSWLSANKNGTVYAAKERSFDGLWIVPLASRL